MPGHGDLAGTGSGGVAPADRNIPPVAAGSPVVAPGGQADANSLAWSGGQGAGSRYATDAPRPGAGLAEVLLGNGLNQATPGSRTDDAAGSAAGDGYGFLGALGVSRQSLGLPARQASDVSADGVGTFNPYSLFAAPPVVQPGEGEGWLDGLPSYADAQPDQAEPEDGGDGQDKDKGEGGEKEAPSPDGTILITTYGKYAGFTAGDHSALLVKGKGYLLYDPGGSYRNGERGSSDILLLSDEGFKDYIRYHEKTGSVVQTKIATTPSQEDVIVKRAEKIGRSGFMGCAGAVSLALKGICGISEASTPDGLRRQAEGAKCGK